MECPLCKVPLIIVEYAGIELDFCTECKGIWFDSDELNLLAEALEFAADFPDVVDLPSVRSKEKRRPCPRCRKKMDKASIGEQQVIIDRCPRGHGLWFDHGELARVLSGEPTERKDGEQHVLRFLGGFLGEKGNVSDSGA